MESPFTLLQFISHGIAWCWIVLAFRDFGQLNEHPEQWERRIAKARSWLVYALLMVWLPIILDLLFRDDVSTPQILSGVGLFAASVLAQFCVGPPPPILVHGPEPRGKLHFAAGVRIRPLRVSSRNNPPRGEAAEPTEWKTSLSLDVSVRQEADGSWRATCLSVGRSAAGAGPEAALEDLAREMGIS